MGMPLNLAILSTIEDFKSIPRSFLYRKVQASPAEIDRQIQALMEQGAIEVQDDHVAIKPAEQRTSAGSAS